MLRTVILAAASAASLCLVTACATNEAGLPPGKYESSHKTVDANGTEVKDERTTNVWYDENGNKKATVEETTTRDPKGLFNKSTTTEKRTVQ